MCNIAGYVGNRDAAPILIEMMKAQEAFAGGYYTGIATLHEGRIYYAKLTGSLSTLLENTDAARLPGNIGIIHSRSKSGGGDAWSHPFVGKGGNCAYVANGSAGYFKTRIPEYTALGDRLIADGFDMALEDPINRSYPTISSGKSVHMSDIMAQLISKKLYDGEDPQDAIEHAFCDMPSEIVGLLISLCDPGAISYARINMPMTVAFSDHGAYLASTPLALPDDAGKYEWLPVMSSGKVYRNRVVKKSFDTPVCTVAPVTDDIKAAAYDMFLQKLNDNNMRSIEQMVLPLFEKADTYQEPALLYEVLYRLKREGKLKIQTKWLEGAKDGLMAPKNHMSVI